MNMNNNSMTSSLRHKSFSFSADVNRSSSYSLTCSQVSACGTGAIETHLRSKNENISWNKFCIVEARNVPQRMSVFVMDRFVDID